MRRVICVLLATLLCACGAERSQPVTNADLERACDSVATQFGAALKAELTGALEEGGATFAIGVCNTVAPDLSAEFSETPGWEIKRVSSRPRNPENAPDPFEAGVLARLEAEGAPPALHEWVKRPEGDSTFYFFKSIRVAELCVTCHGPVENLAPGLTQALEEEYPDDMATGYRVGDFRGAFVVTVDFPEGAAALKGTASPHQ
jgi:hypothetical protein